MRKRICMMQHWASTTVSSMRRFPSCELGGKHSANRFPRKVSASTAMERQSAANAVEFALWQHNIEHT